MGNDDFGESSCKRPGSNDKMSDSDRPLKKARYAWQVKGRYHLKDQEGNIDDNTPDESQKSTQAQNDDENSQDETVDADMTSKAEENLEILGDYLLKQDFSNLTPLMIDPPVDKSESSQSSSGSIVSIDSGPSSTGRHTPLTDSSNNSGLLSPNDVFTHSTEDERYLWSIEMLKKDKSQDQQLARWQARQLAKAFVDNTINRVLDSWLVAPLPQTLDNHQRHLALDVAEFLDNLPNNRSVENQGILMAISAHGLQNNSGSSKPGGSFSNLRNRSASDTDLTDEQVVNPLGNEPMNTEENLPTEATLAWMHQPCNCPVSHARTVNIIPQDVPFHRRNSLGYHMCNPARKPPEPVSTEPVEDLPPKQSENESEVLAEKSLAGNSNEEANVELAPPQVTENNEPDEHFEEHFDFMNAAVSYAIQNKGLTSFGNVDYG